MIRCNSAHPRRRRLTQLQPSRRRAGVVVLTAVTIPILLGFAALAVDIGVAINVRTELQRTADSSALAGVQELFVLGDESDAVRARESASQYAQFNPVLDDRAVSFDPATEIEIGQARLNDEGTGYVFTPDAVPPDAVRVTVHHELDFVFAQMLGFVASDITASAVAMLSQPSTADIVPAALRAPGFGPVDPDIAEANPGKDGPSEPDNGEFFEIGEEVTLFTFGNGPRSPVHLVLDIESNGVSDIDNVLEGEDPPYTMTIGEEFDVWGEGTGNGGFGGKLENRLEDSDPSNNTIIVPIVATLDDTRNDDGELVGPVSVVDFVAVTLTEVREVEIPKPNDPDSTMTIRILVGVIVRINAGTGSGAGTTAGNFSAGSIITSPQLVF